MVKFTALAILGLLLWLILWIISQFSIVVATSIGFGVLIFFTFFAVLWSVDRLALLVNSVHSRCGNCKRTSIIPNFICPNCGKQHQKLVPSYTRGTFYHKCTCGRNLPTTIFIGRSQLKAACPFCTTELATSNAEQFGIQIIGGVSTGKTTFMSAFWHSYEKKIKTQKISYKKFPPEAFDELDTWYRHGISESTTETNASMYSIVHKSPKVSAQLTLYDIAGEAFSNLENDIQQQQFKYCEGLIFIVDPLANPTETSDSFSSFIRVFKELKGIHASKSSNLPVSVIISKADIYKKEIGLIKIKSTCNKNPDMFKDSNGEPSLDLARTSLCRTFLEEHGMENILNLIEGEFTNIEYYPVSAMGHETEAGRAYEPWGVLEPVTNILKQVGFQFV